MTDTPTYPHSDSNSDDETDNADHLTSNANLLTLFKLFTIPFAAKFLGDVFATVGVETYAGLLHGLAYTLFALYAAYILLMIENHTGYVTGTAGWVKKRITSPVSQS